MKTNTVLGLIESALVSEYHFTQLSSIGFQPLQYCFSLNPLIEVVTDTSVGKIDSDALDRMFTVFGDQVELIKASHKESGVSNAIDLEILKQIAVDDYTDW